MKLTEEGLRLINDAVYEHVSVEEEIIAILTEEEKEIFNSLLRKISLDLDKL